MVRVLILRQLRLRSGMECPVCLCDMNETSIAWLLPCSHTFCRSCAQQLIIRHRGACAVCRESIAGVRTNDADNNAVALTEKMVVVSFQNKECAGITVSTRIIHGRRVPVISKLHRGDACANSILRVGDRVRRINGFDVDKCEHVTSIANACSKNDVTMRIVVDKRRSIRKWFISSFV